MANETLNTAMGSISGIVAFLGFCWGVWKYLKSKNKLAAWKYLKSKFECEEQLEEFNRRKEDLKRFRDSTETKLRSRQDEENWSFVQNWLYAAGVEISEEQSVEYLVKQKGIWSFCYRPGIVKKRTAELNRIFEQKEILMLRLPQLDDDASLERFTEQKEKLKVKLRDVEGSLSLQLLVPGKIETDRVKLWRGIAEETTGQAAEDIERKFNDVPQEAELPNLVEQKIREMKELCNEGDQLLSESLVDDDASLERFTEQKEKLEVELRDVEGRLRTQLLVPGKIVTEIVKLWRGKVEEIINGQATKDIETRFRNVPQEPEFPNLVKQKIREMEELRDEGARLPEILVGDDYPQTLGANEMQSFEEWKDKLPTLYSFNGRSCIIL